MVLGAFIEDVETWNASLFPIGAAGLEASDLAAVRIGGSQVEWWEEGGRRTNKKCYWR